MNYKVLVVFSERTIIKVKDAKFLDKKIKKYFFQKTYLYSSCIISKQHLYFIDSKHKL
jgi:hypothetical protein